MITNDKVRSVVARFFNVTEAAVTGSFVFPPARLHGSVARATLHAAIKRVAGVDLPAAFSAKNYGELLSQPVLSEKIQEPASTMVSNTGFDTAARSALDVGIGIDIEHCDQLPASSDPWTEPFFMENFTPAEIAYCLRQPDPRESFCGLWSAKEAVKKCGEDFLRLKPVEIEIGHDAKGRPFLSGGSANHFFRGKNCLISISHSRGTSAAVCVSGLHSKVVTDAGSNAGVLPKGAGSDSTKLVWIGLALGLLNLVLWLIFEAKK